VPGISPPDRLRACRISLGLANAGVRVRCGIDWAAGELLGMAFGMPETDLSSQGILQKCRKYAQLDILVFGMPKIDE
jgi:hypothetical protein